VLVARYTAPAYRAAWLLGAGHDADDAIQEALVKAFRHLSRFEDGSRFGTWLLCIVANEVKNLHRSRRRRDRLALRVGAATAGELNGVADSPEAEALADERRAALLEAVRLLPEKERLAVTCRYFLELSEPETARALGWPLGSVKSRTSRALRRLNAMLAPRLSPEAALDALDEAPHG